MSTYSLLNAGRIVAGPDSIEQIAEIVKDYGASRVLIISDKGVARAGLIERPKALLEAAGIAHAVIQRHLAAMAKGRVAKVMGAGDCLDLAVTGQGGCRGMVGNGPGQLQDQPAGDLRHLKRMGQAGAIEIAVAQIEDLGLALKAPEIGRMDDARVIDVAIVAQIVRHPPPRFAPRKPGRI